MIEERKEVSLAFIQKTVLLTTIKMLVLIKLNISLKCFIFFLSVVSRPRSNFSIITKAIVQKLPDPYTGRSISGGQFEY